MNTVKILKLLIAVMLIGQSCQPTQVLQDRSSQKQYIFEADNDECPSFILVKLPDTNSDTITIPQVICDTTWELVIGKSQFTPGGNLQVTESDVDYVFYLEDKDSTLYGINIKTDGYVRYFDLEMVKKATSKETVSHIKALVQHRIVMLEMSIALDKIEKFYKSRDSAILDIQISTIDIDIDSLIAMYLVPDDGFDERLNQSLTHNDSLQNVVPSDCKLMYDFSKDIVRIIKEVSMKSSSSGDETTYVFDGSVLELKYLKKHEVLVQIQYTVDGKTYLFDSVDRYCKSWRKIEENTKK